MSGEATQSPKLDGSLKALEELVKPAVAPLERSFLWLVFLKLLCPQQFYSQERMNTLPFSKE